MLTIDQVNNQNQPAWNSKPVSELIPKMSIGTKVKEDVEDVHEPASGNTDR